MLYQRNLTFSWINIGLVKLCWYFKNRSVHEKQINNYRQYDCALAVSFYATATTTPSTTATSTTFCGLRSYFDTQDWCQFWNCDYVSSCDSEPIAKLAKCLHKKRSIFRLLKPLHTEASYGDRIIGFNSDCCWRHR